MGGRSGTGRSPVQGGRAWSKLVALGQTRTGPSRTWSHGPDWSQPASRECFGAARPMRPVQVSRTWSKLVALGPNQSSFFVMVHKDGIILPRNRCILWLPRHKAPDIAVGVLRWTRCYGGKSAAPGQSWSHLVKAGRAWSKLVALGQSWSHLVKHGPPGPAWTGPSPTRSHGAGWSCSLRKDAWARQSRRDRSVSVALGQSWSHLVQVRVRSWFSSTKVLGCFYIN